MKPFAQSTVRLGLFASLALLLIALAGCRTRVLAPPPAKAYNLKFVQCASASINVNPNTGTDPEDEMVFVCAGNAVDWKAPGGGEFSIDFATESPFTSGTKRLDSQHGAVPPQAIVAIPKGQRVKVFKYKLTVGQTSFDPYVIIMGG